MIAATRENIYGLDVFTFYSSQRVPYQLTFDETVNPQHTEVSLVNLLGQDDCRYCRFLRSAVCQYSFEYMVEKRCTLFFNMEISNGRGFSLLKKFVRWSEVEPKIKYDVLVTPYEESLFVEFILKPDMDYLNSLKVKKGKNQPIDK